jgi:hypothetical protein
LIRAALYNTIDNNGITRGIPNITTRVIRASYGIEIIEEFDPNIHTDEDKGYVGSLGKDMAVKQMNWYIYNVSIGNPIGVWKLIRCRTKTSPTGKSLYSIGAAK